MKLFELKQMIREEIEEILNTEGGPGSGRKQGRGDKRKYPDGIKDKKEIKRTAYNMRRELSTGKYFDGSKIPPDELERLKKRYNKRINFLKGKINLKKI